MSKSNNKKHIFISDNNFSNPRWKNAFENAVIHYDPAYEKLNTTENTIVWVLSGIANWDQIVSDHVIAGFRVVVLSRQQSISELKTSLDSGARAYAHAISNIATLKQIAVTVNQGAIWLPPALVGRLIGSISTILSNESSDLSHISDKISDRELEVAEVLLKGNSNKLIANELNITERTVKAHITSMLKKLEARDRVHLMLKFRGRD